MINELWLCNQQTGEIEKVTLENGRAETRDVIVEVVDNVITFRHKWPTGISWSCEPYGPFELDDFPTE